MFALCLHCWPGNVQRQAVPRPSEVRLQSPRAEKRNNSKTIRRREVLNSRNLPYGHPRDLRPSDFPIRDPPRDDRSRELQPGNLGPKRFAENGRQGGGKLQRPGFAGNLFEVSQERLPPGHASQIGRGTRHFVRRKSARG